jgi:hypothetical protein
MWLHKVQSIYKQNTLKEHAYLQPVKENKNSITMHTTLYECTFSFQQSYTVGSSKANHNTTGYKPRLPKAVDTIHPKLKCLLWCQTCKQFKLFPETVLSFTNSQSKIDLI